MSIVGVIGLGNGIGLTTTSSRYTVNDPLPFSVLATMVRMGVKYDIKAFRDQAVARLGSEISAGPSSSAGATDAYLSGDWIALEPGLLLKIVNLSHEYRIQRFLPMAYLICIIEGLVSFELYKSC